MVQKVALAEVRYVQVGKSIVVVVAPSDTFGECRSRDSGLLAYIFKCPVAFVAEKLTRGELVPDEKVQVSVLIKVPVKPWQAKTDRLRERRP